MIRTRFRFAARLLCAALAIAALLPFASPAAPVPVGHARLKVIGYVMDGPTLQGVISFYDMAAAIVAAQAFENTMLKAYIRDWPGDSKAAV